MNNCLVDLKANKEKIARKLEQTLMIVTKLTPIIGYEEAGKIAKLAYEKGKSIKEIILEEGYSIEGNINEILDHNTMV